MANQIVCVLVETYGLRIYAIMLPPSDFSVSHSLRPTRCHFGLIRSLGPEPDKGQINTSRSNRTKDYDVLYKPCTENFLKDY